jgi:hypothetical protein
VLATLTLSQLPHTYPSLVMTEQKFTMSFVQKVGKRCYHQMSGLVYYTLQFTNFHLTKSDRTKTLSQGKSRLILFTIRRTTLDKLNLEEFKQRMSQESGNLQKQPRGSEKFCCTVGKHSWTENRNEIQREPYGHSFSVPLPEHSLNI